MILIFEQTTEVTLVSAHYILNKQELQLFKMSKLRILTVNLCMLKIHYVLREAAKKFFS